MKIGTRLAATFGALVILILAIAVTTGIEMARMSVNTQLIVNNHARNVELATDLKEGTYLVALTVYHAFSEQDEVQQADLELIRQQTERTSGVYEELYGQQLTPGEQTVLDSVKQARSSYSAAMKSVFVSLSSHDIAAARAAMGGVIPLQLTLLGAENRFIAEERTAMHAAVRDSARSYATARLVVCMLSVAAVLVAVVTCLMVTRSIVRPLQDVVGGAKALAAGDLGVQIAIARSDEVGIVGESLNRAVHQLAAIVRGIKQASETVASATQQLAAGNVDLSRRTEEQAASLQEAASSMEEITATVRHTADNASQANAFAVHASEIAQRGGEAAGHVIETMHGISESSSKVAEITSVIEGIAFQTNILAINASVEAARAGEQGRGFAVVAGEVRLLAQRSATAAKEVKALIGESVGRVQAGMELVARTGSTIDEVIQSVRRVSDIMGEISSASREQSSGIEQINRTVSQMDLVTQQNAALVEQTAAAAASIQHQAAELVDAISVFHSHSGMP
ncbi:methyl-accepting chemotaxis sensory transducer [Paraburkholderia xenovorans LB400]|uniref:Methyl-accepting chemotaxis sensory transducer n=2 Tax=Paraburkholderia xenovorans TaxID=36873 RepID=Q13JD0_PARXL|nr:methyl-accepting chemotaxis sensory transducer [Paraburkholderia xenovorans LB400]